MRKVLFWTHLAAGVLAGIVVLIMSVTGALLAFERQITAWADRGGLHVSSGPRMPLEEIIAKGDAAPSTIVVRSGPNQPVELGYGRERVIFVDPSTGAVLGENSKRLHAFFGSVENWHRWLAAAGDNRKNGRAITGAANFAFLIIVLSGPILWLPKKWTWQHVRPALWFRGGLAEKARDWNWHNTIGIWSFVPLVIIVASGGVMSYPWANNLVYTLTRSELPQQGGGRGGDARGPRESRGGPNFAGLTERFDRAAQQVPDWRSITLRVTPGGPLSFTIDQGNGGQPEKRATLTLDRKTGALIRWEPFSALSTGRRARSWLRFAHTGEAGGLTGQIIAAVASTGGAVLVYTGIALALRRLTRWRKRRAKSDVSAEMQTV